MTEEQIAAIKAFVADEQAIYEEDVNIVETAETLEDFEDSRKTSWIEKGECGDSLKPFQHLMFTGAKLAKGQRRQDFYVFDLGEKRAVVKF